MYDSPPSQASGAISIGWYRGISQGIFEAAQDIQKKFPAAAKLLRRLHPEAFEPTEPTSDDQHEAGGE